jgi:hypothetical protein
VDVVAAFPADAESFHAVVPGDGAFHDPAVDAEAGTMGRAASGDAWADAFAADGPAVLVMVVGAVGEHLVRALPWPATAASYGWNLVEQWQELGDVVAVAAGQRDGQGDAGALGQDVVLRARSGAVDRARTAFGPRLAARTWEESMAALDQSSFPAPCSSARRSSCNCCQTPARFHSSNRRQHVIPDPKPSSCGKNSHWIPVCNTNKIPHNTCRSGIRFRPGRRGSRGTCLGSNGSIRCHNPSGTIHGGCSPRRTAQHDRPSSTKDTSRLIGHLC